jgi:hypothetical protein
MRINNAGNYEYCRWAGKDDRNVSANIKHTTPAEYFQHHMAPVRQAKLEGKEVPGCSECLLMEFREFWKSSQHQMEHMRVLNTRKVLERKLPVSSSTKDIVVYEKKPSSGSAAARPAFKPNQRRFLDRSGKVYVLGSTTPLVRSEEESEDIPRFEELEDEVTSVQNEEELDDLDNQQVPKEGIDDESDPAYLDFFGQLE